MQRGLSAERRQEITSLQEQLESVDSQLRTKQLRLERASLVKDYKVCDKLQGEKRQLGKEKANIQRDLSALLKKDSKAKWHQKRVAKSKSSTEKTTKLDIFAKKMKPAESSADETNDEVPKDSQESSGSRTPDTLILSDNEN